MASSNEFAAHCLELLSPLGPARSRRMFGGHGFYVDDLFIGIAAAERLYLKVDDDSRPRFEAAGCEPFDFDTKDGKRVVLGFWSAPDDALESPVLMQPWARMAVQAALKALNSKKPAARKAAPAKAAARKTKLSPAPAPAARTTAAPAKKTIARKR
ncbi:TfoX/Sxy family protein [Piscinibacter gummiphilus]|uniref:TfoX/Sxy family protein n=1 Tax=Piscinibacter gummiphilus TaxID=946333 RepID=A0ABZ0CSF0_9BURK|nr:TfoX/Sxy family protein [Piscinibacter gummiphilus]WOB07808.1 TfoX/Sxy family protein [Piscinibacter gummiphilus]